MALGGALSGRLDIAGAAAQFERACALAPGDPAPLRTSADNLSQWGKAREAVSLADRAIKLDPLDPGCFVVKSVALFYARRYQDSISTADQALSMAPNRSQAAATAATCYSLMNQPDRAPAYLAKIPADDLFRQTVEAVVAARKGDRAGSTQILERIRRSWGDAANYQYAQVLSQQRDTNAAFVALDRAFALLDPGLAALPADPLLDPLRGDARFTALAKKLNVPA
jgi:tetratricopeptide (TPR) repeat protein